MNKISVESTKKFLYEVTCLQKLQHKNILVLKGIIKLKGQYVTVVPFFPNRDLRNFLLTNSKVVKALTVNAYSYIILTYLNISCSSICLVSSNSLCLLNRRLCLIEINNCIQHISFYFGLLWITHWCVLCFGLGWWVWLPNNIQFAVVCLASCMWNATSRRQKHIT